MPSEFDVASVTRTHIATLSGGGWVQYARSVHRLAAAIVREKVNFALLFERTNKFSRWNSDTARWSVYDK